MDENNTSELVQVSGATRYQVEFNGKATEYFGIWIVNLCLTILTLGIYSAWAKVRTNRYFYGNTQLDESAFEYLATPIEILKGRLIAVALFGAYSIVSQFYPEYAFYPFLILTILLPGIVVFSMSFRMRNTGYRGLTFHFVQHFKQAYLVFGIPFACFALLFFALGYAAPEVDPVTGEVTEEAAQAFMHFMQIWGLLFVGLFLLFPVWDYFKSRFMVTNTGYGRSTFAFSVTAWSFVRVYIGAAAVVLVGILACLLVFSLTGGFSTNTEQGESLAESLSFAYMLISFPLYLYVYAYIQAFRLNLIFESSALQGVRLRSHLTATYLFYLYLTNTLAIIVSVGLLIPWAMVRTARYRAQSVEVVSTLPLNQFVREQEQQVGALGEEIGEVFDLDIGL